MKRRTVVTREVIDLSSDEETTRKIVRRLAEPVPSHEEVIELRQRIAKLEKDFQGACRYARRWELQKEEAEKRVEFLEDIIDKKPVDGLQDKIIELTIHRDELLCKLAKFEGDHQMQHVEDLQKKVDELSSKLAKYEEGERPQQMEELQRKIDELTIHRDELLYKLAKFEDDQQMQHPDELQKKVDELLIKLAKYEDEQQLQPVEELQKKIDELTIHRDELLGKLAKYEERDQPLLPLQPQLDQLQLVGEPLAEVQQPPEIAANEITTSPKLDDADTTNEILKEDPDSGSEALKETSEEKEKEKDEKDIFKAWPIDAPETIPFNKAIRKLDLNYRQYKDNANWMSRFNEAFYDLALYCTECGRKFRRFGIITHFFSMEHKRKERSRNGAVSRAAIDYWMHKMESIPKPAEADADVEVKVEE